MTIEHSEKLNDEFSKLLDSQKLAFYEERMGELLADIWKDYDEEKFIDELEFIKSFKKD